MIRLALALCIFVLCAAVAQAQHGVQTTRTVTTTTTTVSGCSSTVKASCASVAASCSANAGCSARAASQGCSARSGPLRAVLDKRHARVEARHDAKATRRSTTFQAGPCVEAGPPAAKEALPAPKKLK